ncbi:hypothetical protein BLA29_005397, partial [Euroglyphus maynei]
MSIKHLTIFVWTILSINFIHTAINETESNQICHSLSRDHKDPDGNEFNILAVGLTRNNLLLMTKNFLVYELSKDSLDSSINKLYLNAKPTPMSVRYPVLFESDAFQRIRKKIFNAFILNDNQTDWLCLTTWKVEINEKGIKYDLNNHSVELGYQFIGEQQEVLISTNEICLFYSLRHSSETNGLEMATYKCSQRSIILTHSFRLICFVDKQNKEIIIKDYDETCEYYPVKWPIMKGFVANGRFYLFDKNNVHIFDEIVYTKPNTAVSIDERKYSSFFMCPGSIPENFIAKHRSILMIIMIVLFTLFFLLCCLLLIRVENYSIFRFKHRKTIRSALDLKENKLLTKDDNTGKSSEITSSSITTTRSLFSTISLPKLTTFNPWKRIKLMPTTRSLAFSDSGPKMLSKNPTTK